MNSRSNSPPFTDTQKTYIKNNAKKKADPAASPSFQNNTTYTQTQPHTP